MRITDEKRQQFDALCDLYIYHFCDVCRPKQVGQKKFRSSVRLLVRSGLIGSQDDVRRIGRTYERMLVEYVQSVLPRVFIPMYDAYGARCFGMRGGRPLRYYAGDSSGCFMCFDSFEALEDYTQRMVQELGI